MQCLSALHGGQVMGGRERASSGSGSIDKQEVEFIGHNRGIVLVNRAGACN